MSDEKVIEKIKKLLELAASPNENEAQLAYRRAQDLMVKYCVSLRDTEEKPETIVQIPYELKIKKVSGLQDVLPFVALAVGKQFGVYVLVQKFDQPILLVGFPTNITVVAHALDCILNQCMIDFRKGFAEYRSVSFAPAFWKGVQSALKRRFEQKEVSETGLVVYDPVKKYMEQFKASRPWGSVDAASEAGAQAGFAAGTSAQIRPGVNANYGGKLLQ
jgi:hypothetical protein